MAAWRAVWGAQRSNPVYRARYQHLTSREQNKLRPAQAQTVVAAAILRHLYAVITTGQAWDPVIATHSRRGQIRPPPDQQAGDQAGGRGEPSAALRNHGYLNAHHGQPRPSSPQPDYTLTGTNPVTAMQGQTTDAAPATKLDNNVLR